MSCTDCENCQKSTTVLPDCWLGTATVATAPGETDLILKFSKGNGAIAEIGVTIGGADEIDFLFSDLVSGWFAPGWHQINFFDSNREPFEATLPDGSIVPCITFVVVAADSADDNNVTFSY